MSLSVLVHLGCLLQIVDAGSHIVINTLWLCRSLLAPVLLASKDDPRSVEFKIPDGTATLDDIARVLEDLWLLDRTPAVDPKAGVDILCHMGLAFLTEKQAVFQRLSKTTSQNECG